MLRMQKEINNILKSVENIEKITGRRKQIEVTYIDTDKCNDWQPRERCFSPNCGPFNHNLVGMFGGDSPAGHTN